jgi:UDP-2,3-diacylglucosamine hydrolase
MQPDKPAVGSSEPAVAPGAEGSLAIISGAGAFPGAVAEAVARRGRQPVMFGIKGWADPAAIERYPHHWIAIGQLGRFVRLAKAAHCSEVLLIGKVLRPPLKQIRLDWPTIRMLPRIVRSFRGGDNHLLSEVVRMIEDAGLTVVGVDTTAPEIIMPEGMLGTHAPTPRDRADIARGLDLIAALGAFDVGQAAVVADNYVLGVEAAEGTDNLLLRIAELRRQGRVTTPPGVGVLVKAPKPGQDRRFDLPSIGPQTVENAARAGLAGIAVTAGSTLMADAGSAIAAAERAKMFFVGIKADAGR